MSDTEPARERRYLSVLEEAIGLPLKPRYADEIVLTIDDCPGIFAALGNFYEAFPFTSDPRDKGTEFVPTFTADLSHMRDPTSLLAKLDQKFANADRSPSAKVANLMVYAPSVILEDMITGYHLLFQDEGPERMTDEEIALGVQEELRAVARLSGLFDTDTIILSSASSPSLEQAVPEDVADEFVFGWDDPKLQEWIRLEVAPDFGSDWHDTYGVMALQHLVTSVLRCKTFGFNSGPVFGSPLARDALARIVEQAAPLTEGAKREHQRQFQIVAHSIVDLSQTSSADIANIRHDSSAFAMWREFIDESVDHVAELEIADDQRAVRFARDLERRGADFERRLKEEFGDGPLRRCFSFNGGNLISLSASAMLGIGGTILQQSAGIGLPLFAERLYTLLAGLEGDRIKASLRSHYHTFVPPTVSA